MRASALAAVGVGLSAAASADEPREVARAVVGGDIVTPDWAALRHIRIRSGGEVRAAAVRAAEARLRASKLFPDAPGQGPVAEVLPNEPGAKLFDVHVRVQGHPWSGLAWGLSDVCRGGRAGHVNAVLRAAIFLRFGVERRPVW